MLRRNCVLTPGFVSPISGGRQQLGLKMDEFTLTLKGDGITVERKVSRETALAILSSVLGAPNPETGLALPAQLPPLVTPVAPQESLISATNSTDPRDHGKPLAIREFVNESEPKTNAQTVLLLAQFMAKHEGSERFTREDIRKRFPRAGAPMPKNFTRDFQTAIDRGWIGEDPTNKDSFYVTRTGEAQLQTGFRGKRN